MSGTLRVLSPCGYPPKVAGKALAPSLESLERKTLYLVDGNFDNAGPFMDQLRAWFAEHMPTVETRVIRWCEPFADDPEASAEIARNADAAIFGVGI